MSTVFPFTLYCDCSYGGNSADLYEEFLQVKPKGMYWYGFDTEVLSSTLVIFHVREMLDNVYGGVGKEIARISADIPEAKLRNVVRRRALDLAKERRERELRIIEGEIIEGYANELINIIYPKAPA